MIIQKPKDGTEGLNCHSSPNEWTMEFTSRLTGRLEKPKHNKINKEIITSMHVSAKRRHIEIEERISSIL